MVDADNRSKENFWITHKWQKWLTEIIRSLMTQHLPISIFEFVKNETADTHLYVTISTEKVMKRTKDDELKN